MTVPRRQLTVPILLMISLFMINLNFVHGQGRNEEITIIAPYIPSIQNATKIPFRPEINFSAQDLETYEYEYVTKSVQVSTTLEPIEPMKFNEGRQEKLYGNYVKAGFGNYTTPYLDFLASSVRNEKYIFGARLKHHSSQGGIKNYAPSAFSHNLVSAFGSAFVKPGTLTGTIGYNRDVVHYYGFPADNFPHIEVEKDDIKQRFQDFNFSFDFNGRNRKDSFKYLAGIEFHYFNDRYGTSETQFDFKAGVDKSFSSSSRDFSHSLDIDIRIEYLGYQDSLIKSSPVYVDMLPVYRFGIGQYSFEAGLNVFIVTENTAAQSDLQFNAYPHLKAEVEIIEDQLKAFAQVTGMRRINSYRSLSGMNPYMISTPVLIPTDEQLKISAGLLGSAGAFNFSAEASYAYINNQPLFVNDVSLELQNKFDIIYDDVNLLNIKATLGLVRIRNLEARLIAALYHHNPKNELKAWHLPGYEIGIDGAYVIREKFIISTYILALGSRYARTVENQETVAVKMDDILDLNLGFEYRIIPQASAFFNVNNILNQSYQRWYQYPVQGILFMVGAKFSF